MASPDSLMLEWAREIRSVNPDSFVPLKGADEIPARVRVSSESWFDRMFQPAANPYLPANQTQHSFSPARNDAPDMLCHQYQVGGHALVVRETWNVALLTIKIETADHGGWPARINSLATLLLRTQGERYRLQFQFPDPAAPPFYFSSNPESDVALLHSWHDRVDGFVEPGSLTFVCYKKIEQLLGYEDDHNWFDQRFKAKARPR